jgi:hypothetical protein
MSELFEAKEHAEKIGGPIMSAFVEAVHNWLVLEDKAIVADDNEGGTIVIPMEQYAADMAEVEANSGILEDGLNEPHGGWNFGEDSVSEAYANTIETGPTEEEHMLDCIEGEIQFPLEAGDPWSDYLCIGTVLPGDIYVYEERGALHWTIKNGPDVGDYTGWIVYPYNTKVYFVTLGDLMCEVHGIVNNSHYIMSYQELKNDYIQEKKAHIEGDLSSFFVHSATLLPEPVLREGRLLPGGYLKEMMPSWDEEGNLQGIIPAECPGPQDRFPQNRDELESSVSDIDDIPF